MTSSYETWRQDWPALVRGTEFVEDATAASALTPDAFAGLLGSLKSMPGFLGPEELAGVVGHVVQDPAEARKAANFIINMHDLRRVHGPELIPGFLQALDGSSLKGGHADRLKELVPVLLAETIPGLDRHAKADKLSRPSPTLDGVSILCDLRPVFDASRERIDGMFPVATLRIETTDGLFPRWTTVSMSRQQLDALADQVTNARKKIATLAAFLRDKAMSVPSVGLAAPPGDETSEDDDES